MAENPVLFVGAGPGHPDYMTVRAAREVGQAQVLVYAGSLVHPAAVALAPPSCELHDSASMDLEAIYFDVPFDKAPRPRTRSGGTGPRV